MGKRTNLLHGREGSQDPRLLLVKPKKQLEKKKTEKN